MSQRIGGSGLGLPFPQNLFPSELQNAPQDWATNTVSLAPGQVLTVPAGDWLIDAGSYAVLQWFDPIMQVWRHTNPPRVAAKVIFSDGVNYRLANLTGCPVSATVANGGSGFTQATAQITSNVGGSTWQAVVGGSASVVSIANPGGNYTLPPLVPFPAPGPGPGVPAAGIAVITNGTVSSISLAQVGAGYPTIPSTLVLLTNPADPNAGIITPATIALGLTNAGKITAALCTNNGAALATISALTLTAAGGAGAGATITPNVLQTVTGASVVAGGGGYSVNNEAISVGGIPVSVAAILNPSADSTGFKVRPANVLMAQTAGALTSVSAIFDPGLFLSTPTALTLNNGITTTAASVVFLMGGVSDTITMQPAAG